MADTPVQKLSEAAVIAQQPSEPSPPLRQPDINNGGLWPTLPSGMTFGEIGTSGLRQFAGWVREEFLPQLQGRQAARVYREMGDNSSVVGGILYAIKSSFRKAEWRVLPSDEDNPDAVEKADFAESLMGDMSTTWEENIDENMSFLQYGFAPHEIVYKRRLGRNPGVDPESRYGEDLPKSKYDDGLIGWRRLPIRGQDTVLKWFFDPNGAIKGLTQQPYVGPLVDIPIEKLLLFRVGATKNNPESRSILRTAYIDWYYVKRLEQQEAITYERLGGLPVGRLPAAVINAAKNGDENAMQVLQDMKKIVTNVRIDEQMGLVLPSSVYEGANGPSSIYQYDIDFKTPQAGRSSVNPHETIQRHSTNIMISVLADFIQMGHEVRGTQGLSTNKIDMFFSAVEGYLNATAAVYNRYALPRIWDLNGFDQELLPEYAPDLAQRVDLDVLSNYVQRLGAAGMPLFPNEELQSMLMDAAGLPDVTDPLALEAAGLTDEMIGAKNDAIMNPPTPDPNGGPPKRQDALAKILRGSLAARVIRHQGPKFGIHTQAGLRKLAAIAKARARSKRVQNTRAERIAKYNENHDEIGRFASGDGGGGSAGSGGSKSAVSTDDHRDIASRSLGSALTNVSVSGKATEADMFANDTGGQTLRVELPKGSKVVPISHISTNPEEAEILVDRGLRNERISSGGRPLTTSRSRSPSTTTTTMRSAGSRRVTAGQSSVSVGGRAVQVTLSPASVAGGERLVNVDVAAVDRAWRGDSDFYVGAGGEGASPGKFSRFEEFVGNNTSMEASEMGVFDDGRVGFSNGRHRFAVLRDAGIKSIPVAMDEQSIANAKKHGLLAE